MGIDVSVEFHDGQLTPAEQSVVADGFRAQSDSENAPDYEKQRVKWLARDEQAKLRAVLAADLLWDWMYIDELWVAPELRGEGLGRELMQLAEDFARSRKLAGVWLWTQSWQAEGFYTQLGYREFTRFDNFPKGHSRIGLRKTLD